MNASDEGVGRLDTCTNFDLASLPTVFQRQLPDKFSILNLNIRGLRTNLRLLKSFLCELRAPIKVIVLTESHLRDEFENLFNINGYRRITVNRSSSGGGIAVFLHFSIQYKVNSELTGVFNSHEGLYFTVNFPGKVSIDIFCVYRPPNKYLQSFVDYLSAMNSRRFRRKCIIVGDVNVCVVRDSKFSAYQNVLSG